MLAAIDIGNTDIVVGLFEEGRLGGSFRLRSVARKTEDEYLSAVLAHLEERAVSPARIGTTVISSVVPELTPTVRELCRRLTGTEPVVLGPDFYPRLPLVLPSPREIGTDLVANALAAFRRGAGPSIIADFGTALTFTALDAGGRVLGVAIAPGLGTAMDSLTRNTAQLPRVELRAPVSVLGTDTIASIQAGVIHGYAGLVTHMVAKMKGEMGGKAHVFATGGLCGIVAPLVTCFDEVDQDLTLSGLALAAEYA